MLEAILHSRKTKYIILDKILKPLINDKCENINIFIDIRSILKPLYNPQILETVNSINTEEKYMISSELLNIAGHYRNYIYTRLAKYSTIYFFYSDEICKSHKNLYHDYKKTFYEKYIIQNPSFENLNKIVNKNIKLSSLISEYLPHVYFINTKEEDPNTFPYHIIKDSNKEKDMNLILTDDKILYQYVGLNDFTLIMKPKSDDSKIINRENLIQDLMEKSKKKIDIKLIPLFYTYILSISGYKKYDIDGLLRVGNIKAIELLNKSLDEGILSNIRYDDSDLFTKALHTNLKIKKDDIEIIKRNFELMDIPTIYKNIKDSSLIKLYDDMMFDRVDGKSLRFLNDYYLNKYPIRFEEVMKGEEYL